MSRPSVALLISGGGSNMVSLLRAMAADGFPGAPCVVISNDSEAGGLAKARDMGVPIEIVSHKPFGSDRRAFEAVLDAKLRDYGTDRICLAGFMRILTPEFVTGWAGRMLNIHPSLLPLFPGLNTHQRALDAGMCLHGCTVHEVIPELDAGLIRGQAVVPILDGDTAEILAKRVLPLEHRLYPLVLRKVLSGDQTPTSLADSGFPDQ